MPEYPVKTTSFLSPLWLRKDLPRDTASAYWAGPHAQIVGRVPVFNEYVQHLFSETDHGFWPASDCVGTKIADDWRVDGSPELRFKSTPAALSAPLHLREVFYDEQNAFERVLGQPTGPNGGRWWTDGFDDEVGQRVVLLLRRRSGIRGKIFRRFVHERLGTALAAAGAQDLRTYTFMPWTPLANPTPGVSHDNPPARRYQAAVIFGAEDRAAVDELLASASIAQFVADQEAALIAVHAYSVERSVPVIRVA